MADRDLISVLAGHHHRFCCRFVVPLPRLDLKPILYRRGQISAREIRLLLRGRVAGRPMRLTLSTISSQGSRGSYGGCPNIEIIVVDVVCVGGGRGVGTRP